MALLQISEPGQAPDPHQRRIAVGIDLGTTHSLVACVRHGVPECLPDAQGRVILPSVVRYLEGGKQQIVYDQHGTPLLPERRVRARTEKSKTQTRRQRRRRLREAAGRSTAQS